MTNTWPTQSTVANFYGNPRGRNGLGSSKWESENLVWITPPFKMYFDKTPVKKFRFHKKCADALSRVLDDIWNQCGKDQKKIDELGYSHFSGSYNFRLMRGGHLLSMHSYGCAIDIYAEKNPFHHSGTFTDDSIIVKAFKKEGATWGGDWHGASEDPMHFQFCNV